MFNIGDLNTSPGMLTDNMYLIAIEMVDGTSQFVHITKEQALALGIEIPDSDNPPAKVVARPASNAGAGKVWTKNKTLYNYKVIQPEDLNLYPNNPMPSLSLPRGRPKKRGHDEPVEIKQEPPPKVTKPARTRSGRITRPPVHMEKDFEKIVTDECPDALITNEVSTVEFQPLKTNDDSPKEPVVVEVLPEKKKRSISAQYRCSTCKKAYLGRNRMALHLKKHPDHGAASQPLAEDCEAWGCLVETALKAKEGQKGTKFCKEILNLVKNARTLAKYFFKPAKIGRGEYYIDEFLSSILNIKVGNYRFNENELCKDISIFSFLEFFDDNFTNVEKNPGENIISLGDELDCQKKVVLRDDKAGVDLHFESEIMNVMEEKHSASTKGKAHFDHFFDKTSSPLFNGKDEPKQAVNGQRNDNLFDLHHDTKKENFVGLFECTDFYLTEPGKVKEQVNKPERNLYEHNSEDPAGSQNKSDIINDVDSKNDFNNIFNYLEDPAAKAKPSKQGKELDIFRNTVNNILAIGASDEHMYNLLSTDKPKPKLLEDLQPGHLMLEAEASKQEEVKNDFAVQLHLLSDELILPDEGHVTNILDTSTNSDDIMNVDQFVNERFKKLTEADGELPNGGLGLELPALDCFNFHAS